MIMHWISYEMKLVNLLLLSERFLYKVNEWNKLIVVKRDGIKYSYAFVRRIIPLNFKVRKHNKIVFILIIGVINEREYIIKGRRRSLKDNGVDFDFGLFMLS